MAGRESVLKRQRERKRAEKAAGKREERLRREPSAATDGGGGAVANREDLEGYGVVVDRYADEQERRPR